MAASPCSSQAMLFGPVGGAVRPMSSHHGWAMIASNSPIAHARNASRHGRSGSIADGGPITWSINNCTSVSLLST